MIAMLLAIAVAGWSLTPPAAGHHDLDSGQAALLARSVKEDRLEAIPALSRDPDWVVLTGLRLGGHRTWRWATARPERFATIAPIVGEGDPRQASGLNDMPTWAFHGDRDDVVPVEGSIAMVQSIRNCGGHSRLTICPDTGHSSWEPALNDPALIL